ncbi:MAG: DUF58 domain-containing protein [Phycisphaerae bacterium]|nr:DUF58 domain-containing protein [Phycisphaerae bacterium]
MPDPLHTSLLRGQQAGAAYALLTPRNAAWGLAGGQMANRPGSSLEFMDHREYQPGDDLRHIDWSAFARTDKLTLKVFREEVTPHADIVLDGSRSMALEGTAKAQAALGLAAAVAEAAANANFTHAAWITGDFCRPIHHGADSPATWDGFAFDSRTTPAEAVLRSPPAFRPHGVRILISDLLWMGEPIVALSRLAERAAATFVIQLLARDDVDPPERGNIRLVDSETNEIQEIFLDASAQQRYRDNLARHQDHWQRAAVQAGGRMLTLVAEDLVEDWDLGPLAAAQIVKVL